MNKDKIKILNEILQEYCKYFKYYSKVKVYNLGLRFYIKFYDPQNPKFFGTFYDRKIPMYDIDKWITNYRAKVFNEKNKRCLLEQKQEATKTTKKKWLTLFLTYMTLRELNPKRLPRNITRL